MLEQSVCSTKTRFGECAQPVEHDGRCFYHRNAKKNDGFHRDLYYERKLVEGKLGTTAWISQTEVHALFKGRPRQDGRRIDQWTWGVGEDPNR